MIKVKFSYPYPDQPISGYFDNKIIHQTPANSGKFGDYQFFINQDLEECDYWIVFNDIAHDFETSKCNSSNVIFLSGESSAIYTYLPKFLDQFSHIITCQREIKHKSITYFHQTNPWFVNKSYDELIGMEYVEKIKQLSIITSAKQFTLGHRQRYEFAKAIKNYFGDAVDLFGRGVADFNNKWDVLSPYKYSIAIENDVCDDYITEKLYDCYLSHTFPFYYGSKSIINYYPKDSFSIIDINDFELTRSRIEVVLRDPSHYESHLKFLIEAKIKYLNFYNIFPSVINFIEERKLNSKLPKQKVVLQKRFWDPCSLSNRGMHKIKRTLTRSFHEFLSK